MSAPILITGATQRLGYAVVKALIEDGYSLINTYRTAKPSVDELRDLGVDMVKCDLTMPSQITALTDYVRQHYPQLRAIIHNASDWGKENPHEDHNALFARMLAVHVQAPYQINHALQDLLSQGKETTDIIHFTDYVQDHGSINHMAYAASKAALHNLTLSLAKILAPKVKVNSIAPSLLMFNEWDDQAYRTKSLQKSLLGIEPGAQEAVKAVRYLLSSDYINGHTIHLDGGRHLK